jgi:adenosine deaminase
MIDAGLNVTLNTDDPSMMNTDIGKEYSAGCVGMGLTPEQAKKIALAGVDATWLDDADKRSLRRDFEDQISALEAQLDVA